jgi:hypothetical protein
VCAKSAAMRLRSPALRKRGIEVLLRGVLTLRFVSHAQSARLWKNSFATDNFGNPPQMRFLGAGFLGAPPLFLTCRQPGDTESARQKREIEQRGGRQRSYVEAPTCETFFRRCEKSSCVSSGLIRLTH